jgi:hypothetical protein
MSNSTKMVKYIVKYAYHEGFFAIAQVYFLFLPAQLCRLHINQCIFLLPKAHLYSHHI